MFVYGVFQNERTATRGVDALVSAEFPAEHISAVTHEDGGAEQHPVKHRTRVPMGAAIGASLGGSTGAVLLPLSGLLPVSPLVAAVHGAITGVIYGGLLGMISGLAFWREQVEIAGHPKGSVLVGVETNSERRESAEAALRRAGAEKVRCETDVVAAEHAEQM